MRSPRNRARPSLEILEDRTVPATVRLVSGNLLVSNLLVEGGRASLLVQATANNTFQVVDTEGGFGSASLGTYSVAGNIIITGTNASDSITVNLNGHSYGGNLEINGGNGNDSVVVTGTAGTASVIGGNVTLVHGPGNESVSLNTTTGSTLTIGGSVVADNTTNAFSTFQLGNIGSSAEGVFAPSSPTTVGGNVTLLGFSDNGTTPAVQIGDGQRDVIGGSLSVTNMSNNNASVVLGATIPGAAVPGTEEDVGVTVGPVSVAEGNGNDTFTVLGFNPTAPTTPPFLGTTINGTTNVQFGNGNDYFNLPGISVVHSGGAQTIFNGNVNFTAGDGNDSVSIAGGAAGSGIGSQVNGNLTIHLGNGNNNFGDGVFLAGGNTGLDFTEASVTGNLNITAGNGNNIMDAGVIQVGGNMNFNFGNGNEGTAAVPFLIRQPPGGTINWTSGNGNTALEVAAIFNPAKDINSGPRAYNVNVHFGNGVDTFELGTANTAFQGLDQGGSLTGVVAAGNNTGNVFFVDPNSVIPYVLEPNFTLSNFP